jgi:hypothetical protein
MIMHCDIFNVNSFVAMVSTINENKLELDIQNGNGYIWKTTVLQKRIFLDCCILYLSSTLQLGFIYI